MNFMKKATGKKRQKKATEKKRQKKVTEKTRAQFDAILNFMAEDEWYKAEDFVKAVGVKETRTKELLRELVSMGKLADNGKTKGRRYRKI